MKIFLCLLLPLLAWGAPDRSSLPEPGPTPDWSMPQVQSWRMKNGIQVWHLEQRQTPLISLRLITPRGASSDPRGQAGLSALTLDLMDEGAGERDALALERALQILATDYHANVAVDGCNFSMDLLADQLEPSLAILADILMRPQLSPAEFKRRLKQRLAQAISNEAHPRHSAMVVLRRALFGPGYSGMPTSGIRSTLETLNLEAVKAHYEALIRPEGSTLIIVGAVKRAQLEPLLKQALGAWSGDVSLNPAHLSPAPKGHVIHLIDYPGSAQSQLLIARRSSGTQGTGLFPALLFNQVYGGLFTSRLNMNLREDKGYSYGIYSGFYRWQGGGMFLINGRVQRAATGISLKEALKELQQITGARPISAEELERVRGGLKMGFPARFERSSKIADQLATLALDGRTPVWLQGWLEGIAGVTLKEAQAEAQGFEPEKLLVVIAGDREQLLPQLEGWEIEEWDRQGLRKRRKRNGPEAPSK